MDTQEKERIRTDLRIVKFIPHTLVRKLEAAVEDFITDSGVEGDPIGVFNQTIESIASATFMRGTNDFWMADDGENILGYLLAGVVKDIDNQFCYWVHQAWVAPEMRGTPDVKRWWASVREVAKAKFCRHLVIVSSRNPQAYSRFLGHDLKEYAVLMMENLED